MPEIQLDVPNLSKTLVAKYLEGSSDVLIVQFHGAMNREKRKIPHFPTFLSHVGDSHQLSVPDPGLEEFPTLPACWYLGGKGQDFWIGLSQEIIRFSESMGVMRRIYVGGSSGGFAALLYGSLDPSSTVVAFNPQTNLHNHVYPNAVKRFYNLAWGTPGSEAPNCADAPFDLGPLYKDVKPAAVVYVQSSGDFPHVSKQALPFLSGLPASYSDKLVVDFRFDGVLGHGQSISREVAQRWVAACVRAQEGAKYGAAQILEAKHAIDSEMSRQRETGEKRGGRGLKEISPADLQMAQRISQELLKV